MNGRWLLCHKSFGRATPIHPGSAWASQRPSRQAAKTLPVDVGDANEMWAAKKLIAENVVFFWLVFFWLGDPNLSFCFFGFFWLFNGFAL